MCNGAVGLQAELDVIAVSTTHHPHALDLLDGEDLDIPGAYHPQLPDPMAIGEGDIASVGVQFPARHLVFDRAAMMLISGIPLLSRHLCFAIGIKTRDGSPR